MFHFILNTDIRGKDSVPGITKKQWGTTLCSKILKVNGILVLHQMQEKYFRMVKQSLINPFTPTSDQERISPYNINTISSRQVMRIEKNINYGIIG